MCVLMVCFNVLELLLDETAMPRGMEVEFLPKTELINAPLLKVYVLQLVVMIY